MDLLRDKVAIITGAGSGIGKAIAFVFAEQGAKVVLLDVDAAKVKLGAEEINSQITDGAIALEMDVTSQQSVESVVKETLKVFSQIDILVNNAGIHIAHPFLDFPLIDFESVFRINTTGTFICSQIVGRSMVARKSGGSIINIASASGKKADPGGTAYNASKSAIIGLTRVMALELGPLGIRVNCVLPGATDTPMLRGVFAVEPELKNVLAERTPLGKMATPFDQANACVFLASDLASHITGEQLVVSGGEFMDV